MRLYYVDESGNTGLSLDSTEQPVHWVVALKFTPGATEAVQAGMLCLASRVFGNCARHPQLLHGGDIFQGSGHCSPLRPVERVELFAEVLGLVVHGCSVVAEGIDKARLRAQSVTGGEVPRHPHGLAFTYLLERIDWAPERAQPVEPATEAGCPRQRRSAFDSLHDVILAHRCAAPPPLLFS